MNTSLEIKYYKDANGKSPFLDWLENLNDRMGRAKIKLHIDKLVRGNFGNCRSVGSGLHELKIHFGPGYRVYFGWIEHRFVLILCGGSKRTQDQDIEKAKKYWASLQEDIE